MKHVIKSINRQVCSVDPIMQHMEFKLDDNNILTVVGVGERLFIRGKDQEIGSVLKSSNWSGSLWKNDICIGEFYFTEDGYKVIPISDGFLDYDRASAIHPIEYLIQE